jgi:hypothetical protein
MNKELRPVITGRIKAVGEAADRLAARRAHFGPELPDLTGWDIEEIERVKRELQWWLDRAASRRNAA